MRRNIQINYIISELEVNPSVTSPSNLQERKADPRRCYGLGKCSWTPYLLKVLSLGYQYWQVVKALEVGLVRSPNSTWNKPFKGTVGRCIFPVSLLLLSSQSKAYAWPCAPKHCHPALPLEAQTQSSRSGTEISKTVSQIKPFLFISYLSI